MPLLISSIARSAGEASLCSTIAAIRPSFRTIRPYPSGSGTLAVSTVAAAPDRSCVGTQQRHVAREQHHGPGRACQLRLCLEQRVAGAKLRFLQCKPEARPFAERLSDPRGHVADHDDGGPGVERRGGAEDVVNEPEA